MSLAAAPTASRQPKRRWFLSYHSADLKLAEELAAAIERKDEGSSVFIAKKRLRAGGYWQEDLAGEIAQATAFILLIGPSGIGRWQVPEYYEAQDRSVRDRAFIIVPVLLEGQTAPGLGFLGRVNWLITADPTSEQDLARLLDAAAGAETRPGELWRYTSPYRGLLAMKEEDSDFFFGRERETIKVIDALAAAPLSLTQGGPPSRRLTVLLGNSGVGKSSLAQAGVIAALKRQNWSERAGTTVPWPQPFRDSRGWCFLTLHPHTEPLKALVETFIETWHLGATAAERVKQQNDWVALLHEGKASLRDLLDATELRYKELGQSAPSKFFLYVDQGEELYTRGEEHQRRRFSELLKQALCDPRLIALMSMRSDFLGELQKDGPLFDVHHKIDVPPLREPELQQVIGGPAALLGARFESKQIVADIAQRAVKESARDAGALTLLSYLLDDMWKQMVARGDAMLRLPPQAVELGGVLVERADAFLKEHLAEEEALRRIFTHRLVDMQEDKEPTRRRAPRFEFSDEEWRLVCELADYPNRLLVTTREGAETYAEVAHEAIFRLWQELRGWITLERDFLVWKSGLEADRRQWEAAPEGSKNDALLWGLALAQAESWLPKRGDDLSEVDRKFIDLSVKRHASEQERWSQMRRGILAGAVGAFVLLVVFGAVAGYQWLETGRHRAALTEMQLASARYEMEQQFQLAVQQSQLAVKSAQSLLDQLGTSLGRGDVTAKGAKDMLEVASEIVGRVQTGDSPETIELLAKLKWGAADIQYTLGEYKQQYDSANSARELVEPLSIADPNNPKWLELLYNSIWRMGGAYADRSLEPDDQKRGMELYREAEKLARRLAEMSPQDARRQASVVFVLGEIGDVHQEMRDWPSAIAVYDEALKIMRAVASGNPNSWAWQRDLASAESRLGQALYRNGDFDAALRQFEIALRIRKALAAADPTNSSLQANQASSHREFARLYARRGQSGDLEAALAEYQLGIGILENLQTRDPTNAIWQNALAPWYAEYGGVLKRRDPAAALEPYRKAYALRREIALRDPTIVARQYAFATAGMSLADLLVDLRQDPDQAVRIYRAAIDTMDDFQPRYDLDVFRNYIKIGDILKSQGDSQGALTEYETASDIARKSATEDAASGSWQKALQESYIKIGGFLIKGGRSSEAIAHYQKALTFVQDLATRHPEVAAWAELLRLLKAEADKAAKP